jgi:RimJ/RimL family protein N-acetyltransferase
MSDPLYIYRWDLSEAPAQAPLAEGSFYWVAGAAEIPHILPVWTRSWGIKAAMKAVLKVMSGRRMAFGVVIDGRVAQSGWANIGFCRFYDVELDAAVLGTLFTEPPFRGRGIGPAAIRLTLAELFHRGFRRIYIDVEPHNTASRRMIEKSGFTHRVTESPVPAEPIAARSAR